ncbi:MAG: GntR family transcriptional regulator [Treponemataceae bacterium]|nr:GntR family transcriptional regulator [Treponemataceae bacterium]
MEFDKNVPIYIQIMDEIKHRIIAGALKAGDKVPSVRDLAEELKVNPNTIVRAYQELERERLTETKRGMGTFIRGEKELQGDKLKEEIGLSVAKAFIQKMHDAGIKDDEIVLFIKKAIDEEN